MTKQLDQTKELQRRKEAVVEAAIEWYEADDDWINKGEVLDHAIFDLLKVLDRRTRQAEKAKKAKEQKP
jgi:hypothetical protein